MYKIQNYSKDFKSYEGVVEEFMNYATEELGFDKEVYVNFVSNLRNSQNLLGYTAHYNPESYTIDVYTDNRHPKDVLRSLSHELIHHDQNCQGWLSNVVAEEGYAQEDDHMRKMEKDAYLRGNMMFRDWEDGYKKKQKPMLEQNEKRSQQLLELLISKIKE